MSEVRDQAVHLLAIPQLGTYLTPEGREMVLRALDEVHALREAALTAERDAQAWQWRAMKAEGRVARLLAALNDSPAPAEAKEGSELAEVPPPAAASSPTPEQVAGDVSPKDSHREAEPGDQVAGADASQTAAGPARAPEQDSGKSANSPLAAVPGEGATASPDAADDVTHRWGRVDDIGAAFHLWTNEDDAEAACGETTDAPVIMMLNSGRPDPEHACLDCAALAGWDEPEKALQKVNGVRLEPELPGTVEPQKTCAGHNKSAKTICGSTAVAVQRGDKWFCKRHDPEKSKTCLVPGCGRAGRTAKGSPGIWCKDHAAKLSAAERGSIADRVKRLEKQEVAA